MGVLEIIAWGNASQGLAGRQRLAVTGIDIADLALRNGHQRNLVNAVLPAPQPEVDAAAQQVGLVAGFAVQSDDVPLGHRAGARPELFDDAHLLVGNVAQRRPRGQEG